MPPVTTGLRQRNINSIELTQQLREISPKLLVLLLSLAAECHRALKFAFRKRSIGESVCLKVVYFFTLDWAWAS